MPVNRRDFLLAGAVWGAATLLPLRLLAAAGRAPKFKAVAFDAFPIFDPRPIASLCEQLFPGHGTELVNLWRSRQFEYTWQRTLIGRYVDFKRTTSDALVYAASALRLELSDEKHAQLVEGFSNLKAWPDVPAALARLRAAGVRLGFLSNFTAEMLGANLRGSGLEEYFEQVLSTDRVRAFKPAPQAYQMAIDAFRLPREEIVFAAFAGWDAAGAKSFGFPTFWVNRQNAPAEELDSPADATGNLATLADFVLEGRS